MKYIFTVYSTLLLTIVLGCSNKIPDEISTQIFENKYFKNPITCTVPYDDRKTEKYLIDWEKENSQKDIWSGGLPPAVGSTGGDKLSNGLNDDLLNFLKKHNMIELKKLATKSSYGSQEHNILIYKDKIKEYILDSNATDALTGVFKTGMTLLLGKRELKDFEVIEKGELEVSGIKYLYMNLSIKYSLTTMIPDANPKSNEYIGKARVYSDEVNKIWFLDNIELSDKGVKEYIY